MKEFGKRVETLRIDMGLTQEELGDFCGVTQQYIAKIEAGNIKKFPGIMDSLERHLKTSRQWLKTGKEDEVVTQRNVDISGFAFKKNEGMSTIEEAAAFLGQFYSAFRSLQDSVRDEVIGQLSKGILEEEKAMISKKKAHPSYTRTQKR